MRIAFIGCGVMGEAIVSGIINRKVVAPKDIVASDASAERRHTLAQKHGITTLSDNRQAIQSADLVVLAIKPQTLPLIMPELSGRLLAGQTVLSIVAGARIATIAQGLSHKAIIRAMPNTPAQIGEGITVWIATQEVKEEQKEAARSLLLALGKEVYVPDEKYVDIATAVSGSGPAYIFLVIEAMVDAAVHLGLPRNIATELVIHTVLGSARLAEASGKHPAELKNMVTSPGGTTAEALLQLEEGGIRAIMAKAILAAYHKSKQLGD